MSTRQVGAAATRDSDVTTLAVVRAEIAKFVSGGPLVMSATAPTSPAVGTVWIKNG